MRPNPCLTCGACCAFFRASFYWGETNASPSGTVPAELTERLNAHLAVMLGTNQPSPRCIALEGSIGQQVRCSIHPLRASVCRDFVPSYENGGHNPRCDQARLAHGLPPLTPADWEEAPAPTVAAVVPFDHMLLKQDGHDKDPGDDHDPRPVTPAAA